MQSKAKTVAQYLAELPPDRQTAMRAVRSVILENLGRGYTEGMASGMIAYVVPHTIYPAGYHCDPSQPLPFAGLASQKGHISVYLMCLYRNTQHEKWFRQTWARTGKKLDMGKCCIRFKQPEDVSLDIIGEAIRRVPVKSYIEHYENAIRSTNKAKAARAPKPMPRQPNTPGRRPASRGPATRRA